MEKRENYKDIEIGGRKWRIMKFEARTGSYILIKVMSILGPMFKGLVSKTSKELSLEDINLTDAFAGLTSLSEEDFGYVQNKCLGVCFEMLPAGPTKVLNENGSFGVEGIESDVATVMALTVHALIFNVSGFFGGGLLGLIQKEAAPTSQQNVKI